ncbi:hypothetical protein GQ53DRAFT_775034 [Thozetella sp. PMI_491]|nr:hypothetical protein GQ53DRAFT_775034 [Thozetella sp. PMI_491]
MAEAALPLYLNGPRGPTVMFGSEIDHALNTTIDFQPDMVSQPTTSETQNFVSEHFSVPTGHDFSTDNESKYDASCLYRHESDQTYIGDSFGDGNYINSEQSERCPIYCRCHRLHSDPSNFAFIAFKDSTQLRLVFYDLVLYREIMDAVQGTVHYRLKTHCRTEEGRASHLGSALRLLVNGFFADREIFRSFGYESLYQRGYLTFEHWKEFQHLQFEDDITRLDNAFHTISDLEDVMAEALAMPDEPSQDRSTQIIEDEVPAPSQGIGTNFTRPKPT